MLQSNASDILDALQTSSLQEFPVIESDENPCLVGTIERQLLEGFIFEFKMHGSTGGQVAPRVSTGGPLESALGGP